MNRFRDVLRQASDALALPQPVKSRVLLEIAADLEDAFESYRAQGIGEEEAQRRASERFQISAEVLTKLVAIHRTPWQRFLDRLSLTEQARWERFGLLLLVLFLCLVVGGQLATTAIFRDAGSFLWPVVGAAFVGLYLTLRKAYLLYIKKDHRLRDLRRGLDGLAGLAFVMLALGVWGALEGLRQTALFAASSSANDWFLLLGWLIHSSALLALSLLGAVLTLVAWFTLVRKVVSIERAELAFRLE